MTPKSSALRLRWCWLAGMALVAGTVWLAADHLVLTYAVAGESMAPALRPGDRLLIDRWTCRQRLPRAGEIVLARAEGAVLVKRVERGAFPQGLWLEGDNPADSLDSRTLGPIRADRIVGLVRWRYWPLDRLGPAR